jgi:hypothetical protein
MSYRNPRLVVDTRLGDAFIDYVKDIDQSISQTTVNYAQVAKKNREKNFELTKKINQYQSEIDKNIARVAVKNNVDYQSLIGATEQVVNDLAQAKMRFNSSSGDYEGMQQDAATIKSSEVFLSSGLEQQLGAVSSILESYENSILEYGMDGSAGAVSSSINPQVQLLINAQNPINNIDANVRYEIVDNDLLLITEGKAVEDLNRELGVEGNSYTISSKKLVNQTLAKGASQYQKGLFNIIPGIMGGEVEGSPSLTKSLKEEGVLGRDGNFTKDYVKNYGTYIKKQKVDGYGEISVVANREAVDIASSSSMLKPSVDAKINTLLGFKGDEIYDYVRTNSKEVEIDGRTYFAHKPVEGRDDNGNIKRGEEILILEDDLANRNYNNFGKTGYSDDVIKAVQKIGLDDALKRTGALNDPIETTTAAPVSMQAKPRSEQASLISNVVSSNYDLLTGGAIDEVDFSTLDGLKNYQFEQSEKDPFTLIVKGTPTKDGRQDIQKVDLRDPGNAERVLLNLIEPGARGIIPPKAKTQLPPIVSDLTDPVKNFKDDISEETFMDSLSDDYIKKMSQLGIGLEETSIGSDVILMTKPNGQEVEIDLEEDGWKDEFERNMKGAILMSPSYKEFVSQPKKQEGNEGGKPTLDLLSFYNKLKQSESSNNTTASRVNKSGERYVGELQFGEARLSDYKNATGASFDLDEFQKNPNLQSKVGLWHIGDIDRYIDQLGKLAEGYDRNGLRAVAHLGGKEGMKKWLESKGEANPSDELGTSLTKYYNKFSK